MAKKENYILIGTNQDELVFLVKQSYKFVEDLGDNTSTCFDCDFKQTGLCRSIPCCPSMRDDKKNGYFKKINN